MTNRSKRHRQNQSQASSPTTVYNAWSMANLLEPAEDVVARERSKGTSPDDLYQYIVRNYSFAVPNAEVLARIAAFSPLIDIGAGNGYWARRLEQIGANIIAVEPGESYNRVFPSIKSDHTEIQHYPDRALLMVWPTRQDVWAAKAVKGYGGNTVLYIGDETFTETASPRLKDTLIAKGYTLTESTPLHSWPHFFPDFLQIWQR